MWLTHYEYVLYELQPKKKEKRESELESEKV